MDSKVRVVLGTAAMMSGLGCGVEAQQCVGGGAAFRAAIQSVHEEQSNVGYAAAVMYGGRLAESVFAGMADLEHEVPVHRETRFGVASVTKAFTGTAALLLVEDGRLDLDAPVQRYVPEFPEKEQGAVLVRHIMTHTSGIPHPQSVRTPDLYATHFEDVMDALEVFRDVELLFAPGTDSRYSSSNYNLLAAVIQRASGVPFQEFVRQSIIQPLGLTNTDFDDVRYVLPHRARRYAYFDPWAYQPAEQLHRIPGRWDYSFNMGGGNMISTAEDLVRFGQAFLAPGFFTEETLERIYQPIAVPGLETVWSFGWFATTDDAGRRRLHMNGANPGLQAELRLYPDEDLAVSIVSNSWGHNAISAEMVNGARFAARCMGWPDP